MAGSLTSPTALSLLQSYPAPTGGTAADARRLVGFQHHFSSNYDVTMLLKNRDFQRLEPASRHSGYQTNLTPDASTIYCPILANQRHVFRLASFVLDACSALTTPRF